MATDASSPLNPCRSQSNICAEFREEEFAQSSQRNKGSSSSLCANRLLSVRRHACRRAALRVGQQITDSTARDTHLQTLTYSVNVTRAFFSFFLSFFFPFFLIFFFLEIPQEFRIPFFFAKHPCCFRLIRDSTARYTHLQTHTPFNFFICIRFSVHD